jgi:hypothetical protein
MGYDEDDHTSTDYCLLKSFEKDPKGIVLGDCSINDLLYYKYHFGKFQREPVMEEFTPENLLARQQFLNYFRHNFPSNFNFYRDRSDFTLYEADYTDRRKKYDVNLTMCHYTCYYDNIKLLLAGPNKLLVIEDLCTMELEELQFLFFQTMNEMKVKAKNNYFDPNVNTKDFINCFKMLSRELHTEKIHDKRCLYAAAIYRKLHRIYNNNMLFMPDELINNTYKHLTDSFCPDYEEVFRGREFQQKVSDMKNDKEGLEVLLEKLVIISYIFDREFRHYLENGKNPLKLILNGKFANYETGLVQAIFSQINAFYMRELEQIFFDDLKRIENTESTGRYLVNDYNEELGKLEKNNRFYFVTDKYTKSKELKYIERLLFNQIVLNIQNRERKGISQNNIKVILHKYLSGFRTKETIDVYNELLVEANTQLQLLRLDESYRQYEYKVRDVLKEELTVMYGENPETVYKDSIIKMYNQAKGMDPYILKDGSEPEIMDKSIEQQKRALNEYTQAVMRKRQDLATELEDYLESHNKLTENERNKLTLIRDLTKAFKSKDSKVMLSEGFNLSVFENMSIEQLKKLDIEEVAKNNFSIDKSGELDVTDEYESDSMIKINKDLDSITEGTGENFDSLPAERAFYAGHNKIIKRLREEDQERMSRINKALASGRYIDDPIYIELVFTSERYKNKREEYLKTYYSGKLENSLLQSVLSKGGDIVHTMHREMIYQKYDTPAGKELGKLYKQFIEDIEHDEEIKHDPSKLNMYDITQEMEYDESSKRIVSLNNLISDKIKDIETFEKVVQEMKGEMLEKERTREVIAPDVDLKGYKPGRKRYKN